MGAGASASSPRSSSARSRRGCPALTHFAPTRPASIDRPERAHRHSPGFQLLPGTMYLRVRRALAWSAWWTPTAAMMLMSLLSYVDRSALALLSPTILRDTGLDETQYGWMISAFSAAYFVGNPFWGRLLDRYG